jgi:hypothetical protein
MKIQLQITTTDGEVNEVTAFVPDFINWERHSGRKISDLSDGIGMEDLAFLAHAVLKRTGQNPKPFDGWINSIELIEVAEDDPKVIKSAASKG